jgi:hypothetical protein
MAGSCRTEKIPTCITIINHSNPSSEEHLDLDGTPFVLLFRFFVLNPGTLCALQIGMQILSYRCQQTTVLSQYYV